MSNPNLPEQELPLGWNALLNHGKKTALVCGEYKTKGKAYSTLEVLNKPTQAELAARILELGYAAVEPVRPTPPA